MKKTMGTRMSNLPCPKVFQLLVLFFGHHAEHNPLEHPEHVDCAQDHAGGGEYAVDHIGLEGAREG